MKKLNFKEELIVAGAIIVVWVVLMLAMYLMKWITEIVAVFNAG